MGGGSYLNPTEPLRLRIFARDAECGNRVTEGQEDPRLTGKTHVLNSTYNFDQKSSMLLTMTVRNRHTQTTFTSALQTKPPKEKEGTDRHWYDT
jgi:hypothetical protein